MNVKILLAPTYELAQTIRPDISVEAEYDENLIKGRVYTAAHHVEEYKDQPPPCSDPLIPVINEGTILISHIDLDTLGGVFRALPFSQKLFLQPSSDEFWMLAGWVDVNGPHKIARSGASKKVIKMMYAWWAWSGAHRPDRTTEIADVTELFVSYAGTLEEILKGHPDILALGEAFQKAEEQVNEESYIEGPYLDDYVKTVVRVFSGFVNHLYNTPDGLATGDALVSFNPKYGSITVSLADPIPEVSCREIVQRLWGPEAGGHDNIAGSPRGRRMTLKDLRDAVEALRG